VAPRINPASKRREPQESKQPQEAQHAYRLKARREHRRRDHDDQDIERVRAEPPITRPSRLEATVELTHPTLLTMRRNYDALRRKKEPR